MDVPLGSSVSEISKKGAPAWELFVLDESQAFPWVAFCLSPVVLCVLVSCSPRWVPYFGPPLTEWGCCDNLRRSFIPSQPANTNEILEEIPTPLKVPDDHEPSEVQGKLALVNSRSDLSSFERGGRCVGEW